MIIHFNYNFTNSLDYIGVFLGRPLFLLGRLSSFTNNSSSWSMVTFDGLSLIRFQSFPLSRTFFARLNIAIIILYIYISQSILFYQIYSAIYKLIQWTENQKLTNHKRIIILHASFIKFASWFIKTHNNFNLSSLLIRLIYRF